MWWFTSVIPTLVYRNRKTVILWLAWFTQNLSHKETDTLLCLRPSNIVMFHPGQIQLGFLHKVFQIISFSWC